MPLVKVNLKASPWINMILDVLYSSLGSFYIPVIILVIVYWRIYNITKHHSRQRLKETERTDKTLCQMAAATRARAMTTLSINNNFSNGDAKHANGETGLLVKADPMSENVRLDNRNGLRLFRGSNPMRSITTVHPSATYRSRRLWRWAWEIIRARVAMRCQWPRQKNTSPRLSSRSGYFRYLSRRKIYHF